MGREDEKGTREEGELASSKVKGREGKGKRLITHGSNELNLLISVSLSLSVVVSRVILGSGGVGLGEGSLREERVLLEGLF